jgi:hypothetical protein
MPVVIPAVDAPAPTKARVPCGADVVSDGNYAASSPITSSMLKRRSAASACRRASAAPGRSTVTDTPGLVTAGSVPTEHAGEVVEPVRPVRCGVAGWLADGRIRSASVVHDEGQAAAHMRLAWRPCHTSKPLRRLPIRRLRSRSCAAASRAAGERRSGRSKRPSAAQDNTAAQASADRSSWTEDQLAPAVKALSHLYSLGADARTRTGNRSITSRVRCQLRHAGEASIVAALSPGNDRARPRHTVLEARERHEPTA